MKSRKLAILNDLSGISITASDLTDGLGGVIPSSSLTFDMPTTNVQAGSAMIVNLKIDVPTGVVVGRTYRGKITAEDDSGAVDTVQINIKVNPAKCTYDHDGDGIVEDDIDDLIMATDAYLGFNTGTEYDADGDGIVEDDIDDLIMATDAYLGFITCEGEGR